MPAAWHPTSRIRPGAPTSSITPTRPRPLKSSVVRPCSTRSRECGRVGGDQPRQGPSGWAALLSSSQRAPLVYRRRFLDGGHPSTSAVAVAPNSAPIIDLGRGGWLWRTTGTASMAIAVRPTRGAQPYRDTVVEIAFIASGALAGLATFGNRDNALAVTVEREKGETPGGPLTSSRVARQNGERRTLATTQVPDTPPLHLRLSASDRTRFEFAVSPAGRTWTASVVAREIPAALGFPRAGRHTGDWPAEIICTLWSVQAGPTASALSGSPVRRRAHPPPINGVVGEDGVSLEPHPG